MHAATNMCQHALEGRGTRCIIVSRSTRHPSHLVVVLLARGLWQGVPLPLSSVLQPPEVTVMVLLLPLSTRAAAESLPGREFALLLLR
jgi:hypothetical protein